MRRLILGFAGRIYHIVGNLMPRLITIKAGLHRSTNETPLDGVSLAGRWWPDIECWFPRRLWFFWWILWALLRNPLAFWFVIWGWGPDPVPAPSGSAHDEILNVWLIRCFKHLDQVCDHGGQSHHCTDSCWARYAVETKPYQTWCHNGRWNGVVFTVCVYRASFTRTLLTFADVARRKPIYCARRNVSKCYL